MTVDRIARLYSKSEVNLFSPVLVRREIEGILENSSAIPDPTGPEIKVLEPDHNVQVFPNPEGEYCFGQYNTEQSYRQ
jgi:hypothetical protein